VAHTWKNRQVLVTGGTGFIGSFVVDRLLEQGAKVRVPLRSQNYRSLNERRAEIEWLEGDLRDSEYCSQLVDGIDEVFHLASCRRNVEYHEKRASDVLNENVRMTLALIEALKDHASVPVTFFSTANIPPAMDMVALSQQAKVDGYVLGKAICETLWFTASHQRDFPLLVVRPVGVYGPRDTFSEEGNVIPALMVKARDAKDRLDVWGDGTQERAFLYVEDLVEAIFRLIDAGADHIQYVSSGKIVTIKELSEAVCSLVRPGLPIHYDPRKVIGNRVLPLLPSHAALADMQWTPLAEGMKRALAWWKHSV
jgi:nucleoside-diphosphate-sugar epimerase